MFNRPGAERLAELRLNNNRLTSLAAQVFDPFLGLKTLNLSHNQLKVLEVSLFAKLMRLQFLDMKGNRLSTLPVGLFDSQKELISLDLGGNLLSTLDLKVMTPLISLTNLNISGNPLDCDCNLKPVVAWGSVNGVSTNGKCRSPSEYKDRNWHELENVECTSPQSTDITTPSTDTTPGFKTPRLTSTTRKPAVVTSPSNNHRGYMRNDIDLYPLSILLIVVLVILSLVVIGALVFTTWYKRMRR
jgi:Leucine-rich repeat (LRR) protein